MKVHSYCDKKESEPEKKESSLVYDDIIKDYNNIKEKGKKDENIFNWRIIEETVLCKAYNNFIPGKKLLSFDLDDTLITADKKKSKESKKDKDGDKSYSLVHDINIIISKLEEYKKNNYIFAVFSNQNGIVAGHVKENDLKNKIDKIFEKDIKYPFVVLCAKEKDFYRKPSIGMLELFKTKFNQNIELEESIYVGDAAGRKKSKTYKRNDFSDSDYKFAMNCQMKFYTPEEFFLNEKSDIPKIENKLHDYDNNNNDHIKFDPSPQFKEVIVLIGPPGGGKSTFTENVLVPKGYIRINQDTLKTKEKVLSTLLDNIKKDKKIVIDSTNPKKSTRNEYINLCKKNNYPVRAFIFDIPKELAMHLNNLRAINKNRKHYSGAVNNIPIHSYYKYFEEPDIKEGFKEIVKVNFVPGPFENEEDKKIFYCLS